MTLSTRTLRNFGLLVGTLVVFAVLFLAGPLGWVGALLLVALLVPILQRSDIFQSDKSTAPAKVNCAACGARNDTDKQQCRYCDQPL